MAQTCIPPGSSALWSSILEFCVRAIRSNKSIVLSDSLMLPLATGFLCESQYNGSSAPPFFGLKQENITHMISRGQSCCKCVPALVGEHLFTTVWKETSFLVNNGNYLERFLVAVSPRLLKAVDYNIPCLLLLITLHASLWIGGKVEIIFKTFTVYKHYTDMIC